MRVPALHCVARPAPSAVIPWLELPWLAATIVQSLLACTGAPEEARDMGRADAEMSELEHVEADSETSYRARSEDPRGYWVDRVEERHVVLEIDRPDGLSLFVVPRSALPFSVAEGDRVELSVFPGPSASAFPAGTPHTFGEDVRRENPWIYCFFPSGPGFLPSELFPETLAERGVFALFGRSERPGPRLLALERLRASLIAPGAPNG